MTFLFKKSNRDFLAVTFSMILCSCINDYQSDPFPPLDEQNVISMILQENGILVDNIRNKLHIGYRQWPDDDQEESYEILIDDTSIHTLVLTETINRLQKSDYFRGMNIAYGVAMQIDSINIKADSVIIMPNLDLGQCNLTHLPPEIGKIRTQSLDISWNKGLILPKEITHMDSMPQPYEMLDVDFDQTWTAETFDSLPAWAKGWLGKHNL